MEMVNGSESAAVDIDNGLQWEDSAPIRPLDSPASSSPASPSLASPSLASPSPASSSPASCSPAISSANSGSVATASRGAKKRKAGDDIKQQILAEHVLLREQLVASRQRDARFIPVASYCT
ncbi:uncharacterized protein LOC125945725 [Dermacentor silvarum]|uniref:uncharacterized protein LOC125945725 n=1 Tax=Dermacentor silvarum TaxID=543639 RepID=UPI002100899F|nr:uncharacterized protein LOC125945725 [Dermacentor silvarum]